MYQQVFKLHSELLKAMSHPKRLEVIHLLRDKSLSVSEIQIMLGLPQANLSQHLMVLRKAGVVVTKKSGKQVFYSLGHPNFSLASDTLREILIQKYQDTDLAKNLKLSITALTPLVIDPVCKMRLSPKTASDHYRYKGVDYFFCASGCRRQFSKNPHKYV